MDFSPTKFMSKVDNLGGLARRNKFNVEVTPPRTIVSNVDAATVNFLAKTVTLPERSMSSTTYRSGGRFALEIPYETAFTPVSMDILNTNNHAPRIFWNNWLNHIQKVDDGGGRNYYIKYYKEFVGRIMIKYYAEDTGGDVVPDYEVILHDAWPKTIGNIELAWENAELSEFTVDIVFSRWTHKASSFRSAGSNRGHFLSPDMGSGPG